ncbi:methyl-accepting chemotaxis protein [Acinetobacter nosocomialis]|uniref:methyl-accepting chemotaxis protein n=1 Tax=Acinetobacter nosocomialis TaxID=106654 RepID=UPI0026EAE563|nr:methyl-accepting chemotaxis protein [Acinetobacter nosocomialis]MDO7218273.1 methyl-accepting chemotaxis protein [Acinetobacter nosocomialis]
MKFFKYLVFIIISLFSVPAFAATWQGTLAGKAFTGSSAESVCSQGETFVNSSYNNKLTNLTHVLLKIDDMRYTCRISASGYQPWDFVVYTTVPPTTCPERGYPVPTYFEPNTPIPLRVCKQNPDGTYCVFDASDKNNPIVISSGNYQNITLSSISSTPSPSCTPEFSKDKCDPKDPYGGCYQPPNDNCNRMADGSIYCPPDQPPPIIKSGCQNGATYCDMPPTGCGSGYVPGSYNGKQICVKNSNAPPTDPKDPPPIPDPPATSDPPPTDPKDPPTDPKDPPPPPPPPPTSNNDALLRAIIEAINAVNNKLTWVKNEIVNSVNNVSKKLDTTNQKIDTTNQKLDTVNDSVKATTAAVNANGDKVKAAVDANATTVKTAVDANTAATNNVKAAVDANTSSTANKLNDVVNAINNKPVGGGGTTDVKPVVAAIEKQTSDFKDMMKTDSSDFDTSQYEKIGDASDDPRYLNAQSEATNALQKLSNKLTFSNTACVQDFTVDFPYFGSFVVPLSRWCELLAIIKILIHLSVYILAFRMLDSTVRAI